MKFLEGNKEVVYYMVVWTGRRKRWLRYCILTGILAGIGGGFLPASVQAAEAVNQQTLEGQITDLTQRLNALEAQLKAVKASEKATKEQIRKVDKKDKGTVKWSGSTKNGYWSDSTGYAKLKSEFILYGDTNIGDGFDVNVGLKFKSTTSEPSQVMKAKAGKVSTSYKYSSEKNKIKLEAANVRKRFNDRFSVTVGTQKAEVGEGLWISKGGVNGINGNYRITSRDRLQLFYGRDSQDYLVNDIAQDTDPATQTRLLKYISWQHDFSSTACAGIYYGKQQPETYWGLYGEAPVTGKWWTAAEYIRNRNTVKPMLNGYGYGYDFYGANKETKAYLVDINYGKAQKKGSWGVTLRWLEADQNIFMNSDYTGYDDYIDVCGYKGFASIVSYAVSNHSKLQLLRYWGTNNPDSRNLAAGTGKALAKQNLSSIYIKFNTKF